MLARQRRDKILLAVQTAGVVRLRDLTDQLGVSEMTVRRDLSWLADQGLVERVHGGASRVAPLSTDEPGFEAKQLRQEPEKRAIAEAAASLVEPGAAIALTAGTTTWAMSKLLVGVADLTVVTNSIPVAQELYREPHPTLTVAITGGVRTPSDALVGPVARSALEQIHVDVLFMGVHGMTHPFGYATPNLAEAEMNQAFLRAATRAIVLADHTKWDTTGMARIAPLDHADLVISDTRLSATAQEAFSELDVEVMLVGAKDLVGG